jgi:hypothetical protein
VTIGKWFLGSETTSLLSGGDCMCNVTEAIFGFDSRLEVETERLPRQGKGKGNGVDCYNRT